MRYWILVGFIFIYLCHNDLSLLKAEQKKNIRLNCLMNVLHEDWSCSAEGFCLSLEETWLFPKASVTKTKDIF